MFVNDSCSLFIRTLGKLAVSVFVTKIWEGFLLQVNCVFVNVDFKFDDIYAHLYVVS